MSTDQTSIQPALTAEQWRNRVSERLSYEIVSDDPATLHATAALANDALPNDDRRKITRADVDELTHVASQMDASTRGPDGASLHLIAAKLATLLPPRTDP